MIGHYGGGLDGRKFALWGLAFKPNTDDMREAPSRTVIDRLLECGARVSAYDPVAGREAIRLYGDAIEVCKRRDDTLAGFDGRNLYDPDYLDELGFTYYSIGRSGNRTGECNA